ncbi:MAG: hypothetical protein MUE69_17435 [Myxococcota bacterium]|nr:hypothetical protein [Myxococcota bacterium]
MKPEHVALLVVAAVALAQTTRLTWARASGRRLAARARRLGAEGERRAEELLRAAGYRVIERQVHAIYAIHVDGAPSEAHVRADFLVERRGRRFVADAKRGPEASRATFPATRRQLLEYRHAYAVDGVLLVDAERGRVHAIEVMAAHASSIPPPIAASSRAALWLLLGVGIGVAGYALLTG